MATPSPLFVALLLGFSSPLASAIAATPTPSNDPATTQGAAAILRAQVLLDRAWFGPGEIDAQQGSNLRRAITGYQAARGLEISGAMDAQTWVALNADTAPVLVPCTLTAEDVAGPYVAVPKEMDANSKLPALGFATLDESLGERLTNWDALTVAAAVDASVPVVVQE